MRLIIKKENQSLIIEGQEKKHEYLFSVEVNGIKTKEDIRFVKENGAKAVLIGETFMRSKDKKAMFEELNS